MKLLKLVWLLLLVAVVGCKSVKTVQGSDADKNIDKSISESGSSDVENTVKDKNLQETPEVDAVPIQSIENDRMRKSEIKVLK